MPEELLDGELEWDGEEVTWLRGRLICGDAAAEVSSSGGDTWKWVSPAILGLDDDADYDDDRRWIRNCLSSRENGTNDTRELR